MYDIIANIIDIHIDIMYDIKNLWYHRSMISYPISCGVSIDIRYDIIYDSIVVHVWYQELVIS